MRKTFLLLSLLFASSVSHADSYAHLTSSGYTLALTSEVGNGNIWMYLQNDREMYICLNQPGINTIQDCKVAGSQGSTNYRDLIRSGAKIITHNAVGNGNEWLTFLNGSKTTACLAMPGIAVIECK